MRFRRTVAIIAKCVLAFSAVVAIAISVARLERDRPRTVLEHAGVDIGEDLDGTPRRVHFPSGAASEGHLFDVARLRTLNAVFLRGGEVGARGLRALQSLLDLRVLDLSRCEGSAACLQELGRLTSLEDLCLQDCRWVDDGGLVFLSTLHELEALDLSGTDIGDDGIECLLDLPRLRHVDVSRCPRVTNEGLLRLSGIASLRSVTCSGAAVSRIGARDLLTARPDVDLISESLDVSDLQPLVDAGARISLDERFEVTMIVFAGPRSQGAIQYFTGPGSIRAAYGGEMEKAAQGAGRFSGNALALLSDCSKLQYFEARDVALNDELLAPLSGCSALQRFVTVNCPIRGEGLEHLHGHRGLQHVSLDSAVLTSEAFRQTGWMTQLRSLILRCPTDEEEAGLTDDAVTVSDDDVRLLQGLARLESLELGGLPLTGEGLQHLAPLQNLRTLTLDLTRLKPESLGHVGRLSHLVRLNLTGPVDADGFAHLSTASNLFELNLRRVEIINEGALALAALPRLTSLELIESRLSSAALLTLGNSQTLEYLRLLRTECPDHSVDELRRQRPELRISLD